MNGIGKINRNSNELWGVNMSALENLQKTLALSLDAEAGQYDEFINLAVNKAINYCAKLLPRSFGQQLEDKIKLIEGQIWYELPNSYINIIQKANITIGEQTKIILSRLGTFDFLNLPQELAIPKFYSSFNGKIGVKPIPSVNSIELNITYIGYNTEYFITKCLSLVFSRALYELHKDITGDNLAAQQALVDFKEQLLSHNIEISKQNCEGYITATQF